MPNLVKLLNHLNVDMNNLLKFMSYLLSSLPGSAAASIQIDGVPYEFKHNSVSWKMFQRLSELEEIALKLHTKSQK